MPRCLDEGMVGDRQTQCNRLVVSCAEDVVPDVLVRLETRTVCQDALMKTWPQSMMMVVAPELCGQQSNRDSQSTLSFARGKSNIPL